MSTTLRTGAWLEDGEAWFRVWAPEHTRIDVVLFAEDGKTIQREIAATPLSTGVSGAPGASATPDASGAQAEDTGKGYFEARIPGLGPGALYKLRVDGEGPFPDPCSRAQPHGVHGPSALWDAAFPWTDTDWKGKSLEELVIYEVHVGTATPEGTFDALIGRLADIRALGVTTIELMPLASAPGARGWGYDGVSLFAPFAPYGGPDGLRRLIDAAHREGLAVLIDAVYNHFGPDGNYLRAFSTHYFTHKHQTPWGDALNLDDEGSAAVRAFFLANTAMWIRDYHADGLRLDATHALVDDAPTHLLQEIAAAAHAAGEGRAVVVIAEDERNDARLVTPASQGGIGLDGVWADDFHHSVRAAFAGDRDGYYSDYAGTAAEIAAALQHGWLYEGQLSRFHNAPRGTPADGLPPARLVHCIQNHDQIGNRATGDRLFERVTPSAYKAMSALLLLGPYTPLLFMGQEWNASTPFQYFTDHEPELGRRVTEGRRKEFGSFSSFAGPEVPDPQDVQTFLRSKLDWSERERAPHAGVLAWYQALGALRAQHPALARRARGSFSADPVGVDAVRLERRADGVALVLLVSLRGPVEIDLGGHKPHILAYSEEPRFGGDAQHPSPASGKVTLPGPAALILEVIP
ncbi:malto-oligosyltrehalose trehalohydrolase [Chondromyces apiculatus]|uniref:Malto-oligosyltrehalose trehalohydrolase n=1 Tax=Chondromyces apiculatus DSM 436 TaxID=1192034 RepID=A0A017T5K3_9BACT|nr:malto-oligosyltrehalose trehalohydrolase [Chondromyces apiculatus]EYF04297.1 Malto-oligosyltrehalose trehalohydrolase [Chondromyces apiculatus DSM 436]